jgi:hypothetical protein
MKEIFCPINVYIRTRTKEKKEHRNNFFLIFFLVTFLCVIIYNVIREKENIEVLFSRYPFVRTTKDNDYTYTRTNRHKKKKRKKKERE